MRITPMKRIMMVLSTFGILIGIIFPIYAGLFIEWIPSRKLAFSIGCLVAGFLVGMFSFYVVNFILKSIDQYYKKSLFKYLGVDNTKELKNNGDLLLNMKSDFETLLKNYSHLRDLESKNFKELMITDCLTSAYNNRYLYEYFEQEILHGHNSATVLFCDLDDFKKVNDQYGHTVGDSVLKEVCSTIIKFIPENCKLFRYGGEEFVITLVNHTSAKAFEIAETIRIQIKNSDLIQAYCNSLPLTISIGLATYPSDAVNVESLIDKADQAMYLAKRKGKNLVEIYQPTFMEMN